MGKYTSEELKKMADTLLEAERNGDMRYLQFLMNMSLKTGRDPAYIANKITEYANGRIK